MHVPCKEGPLSSAQASLHRRKAGERGKSKCARKDGKEKIRSFCTELRCLTIHVEHDIAATLWSDSTIS